MTERQYLIDTDVIINYLKGQEKARLFLMGIINGEALGFFSVITEAELLSGVRNPEEETALYAVLDCMGVIEVERDIAVTGGKLRRKYYDLYKTELPDAIIAATAKEKGLILVTANKKHFEMFEEINKEYVEEEK